MTHLYPNFPLVPPLRDVREIGSGFEGFCDTPLPKLPLSAPPGMLSTLICIILFRSKSVLACEKALRGALVAGREKEKGGELSTTSMEFEYLLRKSRCEMLIGGDDISNDVITLDTCFSMFVYVRARIRFALIGGNLTDQSTGSHSLSRTEIISYFPRGLPRAYFP